ncbi:putative spermidine/putrescine transport system permease protein [Humitalea rosea]|uniref:Putative spermidine/putrescine transport system permease protein n=1 Tax=Humitalea rosea TaxID=990373 RepID=A0A2W7ID53_9PROT|nr:ABC transporter permease [Humitalea rosea]PZW44896.1 putative spermidine/putrescine transport system permease protein [Humitalea rosea]
MARRHNRLAALLLAPLLLLLCGSFFIPVARILVTAVADPELSEALPRTAALLRGWDGQGPPPEPVFVAIGEELAAALRDRRIGRVAQRLNFEQSGMRSLLLRTARAGVTSRAALVALDARWGAPETWTLLRGAAGPATGLYLLRALDLVRSPDGAIQPVPKDDALYRTLFLRTLWIALVVTAICVVLAYPVAAVLAGLPPRWSRIGMLLVLVPFWTSVLVRTTAWFVLLQREGPLNAALVALGLVDQPVQLIGTRFAVVLAMVHVLLPFAILPAYSVMKRIDPALMRAAASLGAPGWWRFLAIHLPLSLPGVAAGAAFVFLLSAGYFITPALLGGPQDQMVASFIAFFMNQTVNWGMASALACLLLAMAGAVLALARGLLPGVLSGRFRA